MDEAELVERTSVNAAENRVGFIGLGRMGQHMARHVANAKLPLTVFDIRADVAGDFCTNHGAKLAHSIAEVAGNSDVVITMLPTSREVRSVVTGEGDEDGLANAMAAGSLLIDCSSSDPIETRALGELLAERSIGMVDAPVAGGVVFARDGTLDILLGGDGAAVARARPILSSFGRRFFECGGLGAGHAMKVLNNFINAEALITYAEALTTGLKFGLDLKVMMESMLATTTGRNHPLEKKIVTQVLSRDFGSGISLSLIVKDVGLARHLADRMGMEAPLLNQCLALWRRASDEVGPMVDQTEVVKLWERDAGVEISHG